MAEKKSSKRKRKARDDEPAAKKTDLKKDGKDMKVFLDWSGNDQPPHATLDRYAYLQHCIVRPDDSPKDMRLECEPDVADLCLALMREGEAHPAIAEPQQAGRCIDLKQIRGLVSLVSGSPEENGHTNTVFKTSFKSLVGLCASNFLRHYHNDYTWGELVSMLGNSEELSVEEQEEQLSEKVREAHPELVMDPTPDVVKQKYHEALQVAVGLESKEEKQLFAKEFEDRELCQSDAIVAYANEHPITHYLDLLGSHEVAIEVLHDLICFLFQRQGSWGEREPQPVGDSELERVRVKYVKRIKNEFKTPRAFADHICRICNTENGADTICEILSYQGNPQGEAWP